MDRHLLSMGRAERRNAILFMEQQNKRYPNGCVVVPRDEWPAAAVPPTLLSVWRSREFMVQVHNVGVHGVVVRLSIHRTHVDPATMEWVGGIPWDDLQRLKREVGYGDLAAVEVYPADADIVNVASIRHLWVFASASSIPFAWKRGEVPL